MASVVIKGFVKSHYRDLLFHFLSKDMIYLAASVNPAPAQTCTYWGFVRTLCSRDHPRRHRRDHREELQRSCGIRCRRKKKNVLCSALAKINIKMRLALVVSLPLSALLCLFPSPSRKNKTKILWEIVGRKHAIAFKDSLIIKKCSQLAALHQKHMSSFSRLLPLKYNWSSCFGTDGLLLSKEETIPARSAQCYLLMTVFFPLNSEGTIYPALNTVSFCSSRSCFWIPLITPYGTCSLMHYAEYQKLQSLIGQTTQQWDVERSEAQGKWNVSDCSEAGGKWTP